MPLRPIRRRDSAHEICEATLRRAMLDGELAAGEKLPPERALAVTLGVSRLTLRAALAGLATRGLLSVKHGSGYIVRSYIHHGGADLLSDLASDSVPIATELLRVRRHLAHAVLEHLVEQPPSESARRGFDDAVTAMAAVVAAASPLEALAAADLDVVRALVGAGRSPVLALCLNPVINVIAASASLREALYGDPQTNLAGWRALGVWLRAPGPDSLGRLLALLAAHDELTVKRLRRRRR